MQQEGGCLCGAVRYAVRAEPMHVTICFCRFCQRATGSTMMVEPIFRAEDFAFTAAAAKTYDLVSAGSGKRVTAHFCDTCGTKVLLSFERWPDIVGVYVGTLDDPDWIERTGENVKAIFLSSAQHGTLVPAHINAFDEHATTNSGDPLTPTVFDTPHEIRRR